VCQTLKWTVVRPNSHAADANSSQRRSGMKWWVKKFEIDRNTERDQAQALRMAG